MGWLLQNALLASAGALLLLLALRVWRPPPRWEHLLWLLIALKFVLPPVAVIGVTVPAALGIGADAGEPQGVPAPAEMAVTRSHGDAAVQRASAVREGNAVIASSRPSMRRIAGVIWLAGAMLVLAKRIAAYRRWRRARRPRSASTDLQRLVTDVADALGVNAPPVHVDATLRAPVVTGVLRPRLWWPAQLERDISAHGMRTVMAHELAHIRRGDVRAGVVELANDCIWWWYPGWHLVRRHLRDAAERACDDVVVTLYPHLRRAYAGSLLDVACAEAVAPEPAVGFATRGAVQRRLHAIVVGEPCSESRGLRAVAVLVLLLVLPAWRVQPAPAALAAVTVEPRSAAASPTQMDDIVAALSQAAGDVDAQVRRAAANALRDLGGVAAEAVLRTQVDDPDEHVRHAARSALGLEPTRPNLVFPQSRPDPPLDDRAMGALLAVADRAGDASRLDAIRRLGNLRDARAVPVLLRALGDAAAQTRQAAADALGNVGAAAGAGALADLLNDPQARVRQSAAGALGSTGTASEVAALARALKDVDAHVRSAAAGALGQIGRRLRQ